MKTDKDDREEKYDTNTNDEICGELLASKQTTIFAKNKRAKFAQVIVRKTSLSKVIESSAKLLTALITRHSVS